MLHGFRSQKYLAYPGFISTRLVVVWSVFGFVSCCGSATFLTSTLYSSSPSPLATFTAVVLILPASVVPHASIRLAE